MSEDQELDEMLGAMVITPEMINYMLLLLGDLLGERRALLAMRLDETPVLPISEDECERLMHAAARYTSGTPSLGLALGLAKLEALYEYIEFVVWYIADVRPQIQRMAALYNAGEPSLAVQAREVFIAANDANPRAFVGQLTRYLKVREDNAALEAKREGRDDLEVQTLRAERELLLSGPWGDVAHWERLFSMMDVDLTELLPPLPPAD
jgi:hypothetical protein